MLWLETIGKIVRNPIGDIFLIYTENAFKLLFQFKIEKIAYYIIDIGILYIIYI